MVVIHKYWKNSNTGDLLKSQEFTEINITGIPIYYYDLNGKGIGENLDIKGFVEISEKKWNRGKRKINLTKHQ